MKQPQDDGSVYTIILPSGYAFEVNNIVTPPVMRLYKDTHFLGGLSDPHVSAALTELLFMLVTYRKLNKVPVTYAIPNA
jgi:hypothetical protein